MTRPDPNAPDPDSSANQEDAVWLDLVARLEGRDQGANPGPAETREAAEGPELPKVPVTDSAGADSAAVPRPFSDFDPLGLAAGVPIELSAEERLARGEAAVGALEGPAAAGRQDGGPGPRDYEAADDDPFGPGEFVPEEPPSLAGTDPLTVLAWLGAVGGPVALLLSAMFWRSAPLMAILGMVAAFAASLVFLIMKLPGEKDEHDDGARI